MNRRHKLRSKYRKRHGWTILKDIKTEIKIVVFENLLA